MAAAVDAASATAINSDDHECVLMVTQARLGSCLTALQAERARAALGKLGIAIITHSHSSNSTGVAMVIVSSSDLEVRVSIVSLRARLRQQNFNRLLFRASFSWHIRVFNRLSLPPSLQNGGATSSCMACGNWLVVSAKTWRAAPQAAGAAVALVTVIVAAVLEAG